MAFQPHQQYVPPLYVPQQHTPQQYTPQQCAPQQYVQQPAPVLLLLDHLNNPTQALSTYSDALFNFLDRTYEPRGTQLLEDAKMVALWIMSSEGAERASSEQLKTHLPWMSHLELMAFSVETIFTEDGPAVTRRGFLTFQRALIMRNPNEAFKTFTLINQSLRLVSPFVRSQFLHLPDPQLAEIDRRFGVHLPKRVREVVSGAPVGNNFDAEVESLKEQERRNILSNMRCQMSRRQVARIAGGLNGPSDYFF